MREFGIGKRVKLRASEVPAIETDEDGNGLGGRCGLGSVVGGGRRCYPCMCCRVYSGNDKVCKGRLARCGYTCDAYQQAAIRRSSIRGERESETFHCSSIARSLIQLVQEVYRKLVGDLVHCD